MKRDVRQNTNIILQMIEDGILDAKTVALACMKYMSEDEVTEMAIDNEFITPMEDEVGFVDSYEDHDYWEDELEDEIESEMEDLNS